MRTKYLGILLPSLFFLCFQPLALALNPRPHLQGLSASKRSSTHQSPLMRFVDLRPKSEWVQTSFILECELYFPEEVRVAEFRAGLDKAIILQVVGLEERIYSASESIVFEVEVDYWHDDDIFYLSFEENGQSQTQRMSLPNDPDRGPMDLSGGSSGGPTGPGDIGDDPNAPYCPPVIFPGKRSLPDDSVPDHVTWITEDTIIEPERNTEIHLLEDQVQTATQQPLDDTTFSTGPNPWLSAEELERIDGLPRVPLNTVEGVVQIPYTIIEEEGQLFVQIEDDWIIGTLEELQTAAKRALAFNAAWYPDGLVKYRRGTNLDHVMMLRAEQAFEYMEEHTPIRFQESDANDSFKLKETCSEHYSGRVKFYWAPNANVRQMELSGHAYCDKKDYPSTRTVVHEMFHMLGFAHVHQRPDRNQYVTLIDDWLECTNIFINFNTGIVGQDVFNNFNYGLIAPWDWNSITYTSSQDCYIPNNNGEGFARANYQGHDQMMSIHDINALYRKYGKKLDEAAEVTQFGSAVASADFDDDGLVDTVAVGISPYASSLNHINLYFFRGVATDESEGGPGIKQVPWFVEYIGLANDLDDRLVLTTGDLNGDLIPEVIVGHPDHSYTSGRVGIAVVNTPDRFDNTAPWGARDLERFRWLDRRNFALPYGDYRFGEGLATGNLSASSHDDLMIGMPLAEDSNNALKRGGAVIHMRGDDQNDFQIVWNRGCENAQFGFSISTIPEFQEVNGVRRDCMVVGAPEDYGHGAIHVLGASVNASNDLISPDTLETIRHDVYNADYGYAVAGFTTREISNIEGEFYVAVGAPKLPYQGINSGSIYLHRFNGAGKTQSTWRLTEDPAYTTDQDRFGATLAVNQAVIGNLRQKASTHIAIGAPNALYQGSKTGKIYIWQPWLNAGDQTYTGGLRIFAGSQHSRLGTSVASFFPAPNTPVPGGFVIGAPKARVPDGNLTFSPGAAKTILNTGTPSNWQYSHQWWSVNTTGDRLSSNL